MMHLDVRMFFLGVGAPDGGTPKRWIKISHSLWRKNPVKRPVNLRKLSQISEKRPMFFPPIFFRACTQKKKTLQIFVGTYFWRCNNHPLCSSGSSSTSSMVINALSSASAWALSSKSFRMYSSLVIPIMSKKCSSGSSWSQEKASVERWGGNWMTWWPSKQENVGRLSVLFVVQILPEEEAYTDWRYFEPQKQITTSPIKIDQLHDKEQGEKNAYLQCPIQCLKTPACLLKDRCLRQAMVSFFCKTIFPPSTLLRAKPSAASSFRCLELPSKLIFLRVLEGNAQDSMSCQLRPQPIGFWELESDPVFTIQPKNLSLKDLHWLQDSLERPPLASRLTNSKPTVHQ